MAGTPGRAGFANDGQHDVLGRAFQQVQEQIFEGRGCTSPACHGEGATGGLDLRADRSYESLGQK